jgi:hypothetical protein
MALPTPRLEVSGSQALSSYLKEVIKGRESPATWFGATTAEGEIYLECEGERIWGDEAKGSVSQDTSTY